MEKLPARSGWEWVKEGFALFRKQPAEMATLFISYMFLMLTIGIIPILGQMLPLILVPVFSVAFLQAGVHIESGKKIFPNLLMTGFRSPGLKNLLLLGVLHLAAAFIALSASRLIDGGVFWSIMLGQVQLDTKAVQGTNILSSMLFAGLVYLPASMAFWYAAPLIAWQQMNVGKAIFYSFFAVRRELRAFMVYGLSWAVIGIILPTLISVMLALLFQKSVVSVVILLPMSLLLTVILYCSFYPTYTRVFGNPQQKLPVKSEL